MKTLSYYVEKENSYNMRAIQDNRVQIESDEEQ